MSASGRPESFTAEVIWSVEFAEQAESRANAIIDIASLMTSPKFDYFHPLFLPLKNKQQIPHAFVNTGHGREGRNTVLTCKTGGVLCI